VVALEKVVQPQKLPKVSARPSPSRNRACAAAIAIANAVSVAFTRAQFPKEIPDVFKGAALLFKSNPHPQAVTKIAIVLPMSVASFRMKAARSSRIPAAVRVLRNPTQVQARHRAILQQVSLVCPLLSVAVFQQPLRPRRVKQMRIAVVANDANTLPLALA
jgi:hypothetical protein